MATKDKKPEVNVVSKAEIKEVKRVGDVILEQKFVTDAAGIKTVYTKKRMNSGIIMETYGDQDGRPTDSK